MFNLRKRLHGTQLFLSRLSLQARFLLIFGASSLFFALAIWFVFNSVAERMVERIGARFAEEQALYDRTHTLQPLIREVALARQMADNAIIKRWAANERNPQLYRQAQAELEKYRQRFQGGSYFLAIAGSGHYYYNDAGGQSPDNTQPRFTLDPAKPADAWFYATVGSAGDYNINVDANPNLGVTKAWVNVLLRDGDKVLGVLGTGLDMGVFARQADAPRSGITNLLIDRSASIQIYRNTGNIDFSSIAKPADHKHSTDQLLDNPEDRMWVRQAIGQFENGNSPATKKPVYIKGQRYLADSPVATRFVHIRGKPYLAGMVALPETEWYDVTLLDLSVLLPQHDFLEVVLAIGGVSLALMMILLFSLRRLVLRPVAVLTAASDRIRQGDYASAPAEKGSGEIGQLTVQFQAMRHAVHKTHSWMEEEINKRTRQLSDAKEMLEVSLQQEKNSRENQANLLSLMAHEIRSPIAVIGNTAQMLNALAQTKQPDWQPRIEKIMGAVLQLALLMNKFLDEDRINMKDNELNLKVGDLNIFCGELADTLAANHDRPIRYMPYDGDAMIPADWHLISIAIGNLIDNAIKYSPPDSDIDLRIVQNNANMLCVEVTDQGAGIAPELQQRIFNEKFIRGEHGSKIRGTGLGLYLINWIATSHGGYAEVFSTPGNGSTFRLCLPLRKLV
ncbi:MAG: HAMP domain-containing sensor histidine kinase [Gallionella sp.]|nr:HAMP domain-containing sensor histidine kinase [Gallionella sp.]